MFRKPLLLLVALAIGGAGNAMAQTNLVQNPSFETVSTQTINTQANITAVPTLWTQSGSSGCTFQALSAGQTAQSGADFTIGVNASGPSNGTRVLISDQGPSNTSCQIFQDVVLPANATITLTVDAGFVFRNNGTPGSNGSVTVTTTSNVLLASVYSRTDAQGTDALATRPSVDLSAFAGQTVRIRGSVSETGSNWAGLQMDNVRVFAIAHQTITFGALGNKTVGDAPFGVSATASSGLTVTFSSLTAGVCSVVGTTVTLVTVGTCTIAADQAGNANLAAALQVTRSFTVASACSALVPAQLPVALIGIPYTQTITLGNSVAPVTWSVTGSLPAGIAFNDGLLSGTPQERGAFPVTLTATDRNGCQATLRYTVAVSRERLFAVATGAGAPALVRTLGINGAVARSGVSPYAQFRGGVSVALGDTNDDGVPDTITGAGSGGGPHVQVLDGATGRVRLSFFAYEPTLTSGVEVAAGDVNGDGAADIIVAPGFGGPPVVRVFDGRTGRILTQFFGMSPSWTSGLHVAAGDVTGDGLAKIIVGAGPGGSPEVRIFDRTGTRLGRFLAEAPTFTGGIYVAAGDVTGDGIADIVTGDGAGGSPQVRVFDGATGTQLPGALGGFLAYTPAFAGGVRVGAGDLNGDGRAEVITAAGPGGGPHVRVWDGASGGEIFGLFAFDPSFTGGVFVAGPAPLARMALDLPQRGSGGMGSVRVAGWALHEGAPLTSDSGTDAVHAWAYPVTGGGPVFVGFAPVRGARSDVAAAFGGEFLMSGFDFTGPLASGTYDLVIFVRNSRTLVFDQVRVVRIVVQ